MKTVALNLYKFNELSEEAKEKVINSFRDDPDVFSFASECCLDDLKDKAAMLGIDIKNLYYSGFCSQGDGACYEGEYSYKQGALKAIKEAFPEDAGLQEIALNLQRLQRRYFYRLSCTTTHRGHYYHESCVYFDHWHNAENADEELEEILRDFMRYCYKCLEAEYIYVNSEEAIIETIEANDYDFTESGEIY